MRTHPSVPRNCGARFSCLPEGVLPRGPLVMRLLLREAASRLRAGRFSHFRLARMLNRAGSRPIQMDLNKTTVARIARENGGVEADPNHASEQVRDGGGIGDRCSAVLRARSRPA